ncbi:hypothetical protein D9758_003823 [Tetrapyrgos nigripes]|uniref:Uncharacterized protein n=1 Tax=Tetrapyrgos nigripes TaxID=182062 RepID=A0A8H5GM43_9AGAR|nr:hypothetical protein D9758_003823 [Tetrapyrgos nigripes]
MDLKELDALVHFLQVHSIEESTKSNYATGAHDYICFCTSHNLPLDPTLSTLSCYVAFTSRHIASAPKYLTGACHYLKDIYPYFDESRSSPLVPFVAPKRFVVMLFTTSHLSLPPTSKVLLTKQNKPSITMTSSLPQSLPVLSMPAITLRSSLRFEDSHAAYHLPYHKADPFYCGTDILLTSQTVGNPVQLLQDYADARDRLYGARAALFIREDGSLPTRAWFDSKFFAVVGKEFGGHSARAGGATFYAGLGLSESIIQALGRWSSTA